MQQEAPTYEINLINGIDYYSLNKDFQALFYNFHPIYYLYQYWGVERKQDPSQNNQFPIIRFQFYTIGKKENKETYASIQLDRQINEESNIFIIKYYFGSQTEIQSISNELKSSKSNDAKNKHKSNIQVRFQKILHDAEIIDKINVKIYDYHSWFQTIYNNVILQNQLDISNTNRSSLDRKVNANQIQYFYKQPKKPMNQQKHYSIALQGGGVKGISYIGVNRALKAEHGQQIMGKIKNIIGSSAGGILGLAFCCDVPEELLLEVVTTLGGIPTTDKIQQSQQFFENQEKYIEQLKTVLINFGIVDIDLINFISEVLQDEQIVQKIIQLLQAFNSELAGFLIRKVKDNKHPQKEKKLLTFSRLLSGEMMYGKQIAKIACKCLAHEFQLQKVSQKEIFQKMEKITFKDLYEKNQKEFTCTSVDLKDRIIRFFNHKTTPNMPVCYAVQMTGSFPVAFQRQKWKQQWGSYYIHYHSTRRQKNLQGHQFTDGGMLSNFPMKFLDNEYMRPMYFSHQITEKTVLYGFGLLQVKDQEWAHAQQIKKKEALEQLKKSILKVKYVFKGIGNTLLSLFNCKKTISVVEEQQIKQSEDNSLMNQFAEDYMGNDLLRQLQRVPLIRFGINLLKTFFDSDINFQKECFDQQILNTGFKNLQNEDLKKNLLCSYNHKKYTDAIRQIDKKMRSIFKYQIEDVKNNKLNRIAVQNMESSLKQIQRQLKSSRKYYKQNNLIEIAMRLKNIFSIISLYTKVPKKQQYLNRIIKIVKPTFFYRQNICRDKNSLMEIIIHLKKCISNSNGQTNQLIKKIIHEEVQYSTGVKNNIHEYLQFLKKQDRIKFVPIPMTSIIKYIALENIQLIASPYQLKKLLDINQILQIPQLAISSYGWKRRRNLREYVQRILSRNLQNSISNQKPCKQNIHIVLESKHISQIYFNDYLTYIEQAIQDFNQQNSFDKRQACFKIKTFTASGYQSLAALLYANKLQKYKINRYVWEIKDSILPNLQAKREFEQYNWTNTNQKVILEIQQRLWKEKYNLMQAVQNQIQNKSHLQNIDFNEQKMQFLSSKQDISQSFQVVISYLADAKQILEDETQGSISEREQKVKKLLTICKGQNYKRLQKINKQSKQFYKCMLGYFSDLVQYTLYIYPTISDPIIERIHTINDKSFRKEAWKGVILNKTLSNMKFKSLIKRALQDIGLPPDCTLRQYYTSVKEKDRIKVNFLAIESVNERLTIINHHTRPQMPVWAAIIATSSLPYMHQPLSDSRSWRYTQQWKNISLIAKYFGQESNRTQYLQSGNNLSRFPLQIITNRKIRNLIGAQENQTYLSFTFDDLANQHRNNSSQLIRQTLREINIKPLDFKIIAKMFCQRKNLSQFFGINSMRSRVKELTTYINSNDNTYLNVYRKQSIQLPIRVGTLNFDRVNDPQTRQIMPIIHQCIEDANNVTRQKINNTEKIIETGKGRKIYIKIKNRLIQKQEKQKKAKGMRQMSEDDQNWVLQFTSGVAQDFFDMTQRYRVFYELTNKQPPLLKQMNDVQKYFQDITYKQMKRDTINLTDSKQKSIKYERINLKILYPSLVHQNNINKDQQTEYEVKVAYHQLNLEQVLQKLKRVNNNRHIFQLKYDNFYAEPYPLSFKEIITQKTFQSKVVKSFYPERWAHQKCHYCYGSFKNFENIQQGNCTPCKMNKKLLNYCENCNNKFCVNCKFVIDFRSEGLYCPLNHKIVMSTNDQLQKTPQKTCSSCNFYCSNFYVDKECKMFICDLCVAWHKLKIK